MSMPYGSGFSPLLGEPRSGLITIPNRVATLATLTTAGGVRTATAAELLGGMFVLNVDDAQTLTLPTGALLNASIPSCAAGASFEFFILNTGDSTLTVAAGTGGTLASGSNSKTSTATVLTNCAAEFIVVITGVLQNGDSSDSYTIYRKYITAAVVA